MDAEKIKHLEFVQNVITRMNTNSFLIKGWTVTLVAAISTFAAASENNLLFLASLIPPLIFWFLDSYYLQQERKFRGIYNSIVDNDGKIALFEMNPAKFTGGKYEFNDSFTSITLRLFYGLLILILVLIYFILECLS